MFEFLSRLFPRGENPDDKVERRYYRFHDALNPIGPAVTYIEAIDGWHLREISRGEKDVLACNVRHPQWGLVLCDDQGDYSEPDEKLGPEEITASEFEQVWGEHLRGRAEEWKRVRKRHPVGTRVEGKLAGYYPQGIVVDLGDEALGLVDHQSFRRKAGFDGFARYTTLEATVCGSDETFQWLLLEDIRVSGPA